MKYQLYLEALCLQQGLLIFDPEKRVWKPLLDSLRGFRSEDKRALAPSAAAPPAVSPEPAAEDKWVLNFFSQFRALHSFIHSIFHSIFHSFCTKQKRTKANVASLGRSQAVAAHTRRTRQAHVALSCSGIYRCIDRIVAVASALERTDVRPCQSKNVGREESAGTPARKAALWPDNAVGRQGRCNGQDTASAATTATTATAATAATGQDCAKDGQHPRKVCKVCLCVFCLCLSVTCLCCSATWSPWWSRISRPASFTSTALPRIRTPQRKETLLTCEALLGSHFDQFSPRVNSALDEFIIIIIVIAVCILGVCKEKPQTFHQSRSISCWLAQSINRDS